MAIGTKQHFLHLVVLSTFLLGASCSRSTTKEATNEEPIWQRPTITELFNLRSRCAELGDNIGEANRPPLSGSYSVISHYTPRTNRCYVETNSISEHQVLTLLFDGQTREIIASLRVDKDTGMTSGTIYSMAEQATTSPSEINQFIINRMADDRKQ